MLRSIVSVAGCWLLACWLAACFAGLLLACVANHCLPLATCDLLLAACDLLLAVCDLLPATCCLQRTALRRSACFC